MQPIPLRSSEQVKRIAAEEVRPLLPEDWPHGRILNVTAALYGHKNWAHVRESVSPTAPDFLFDQDLSHEDFTKRRVALAKHVEAQCSIGFPYAFELVTAAAVTRDFRRERSATVVPEHEAYQKELSNLDWWWVASIDYHHPLVTKGFVLCQTVYLADIANRRLGRETRPKTGARKMTVLLFEDMVTQTTCARFSSSLYFKVHQALEVEPPPFAEMLEPSYRVGAADVSKLAELFGGANWPKRIEVAQKNYALLRTYASHPPSGVEPVDIRVRDVLRKPWYWPMKCRSGQLHLEYEYERLERAKWG
jgi:hypothetical protein